MAFPEINGSPTRITISGPNFFNTGENTYDVMEPMKDKKRRINLPNIDAILQRLMKLMERNKSITFRAQNKSS